MQSATQFGLDVIPWVFLGLAFLLLFVGVELELKEKERGRRSKIVKYATVNFSTMDSKWRAMLFSKECYLSIEKVNILKDRLAVCKSLIDTIAATIKSDERQRLEFVANVDFINRTLKSDGFIIENDMVPVKEVDSKPKVTITQRLEDMGVRMIDINRFKSTDNSALNEVLETAIASAAGPKYMDRKRPYTGQAWTTTGERGKLAVRGLTMRDLHDCYVRAIVLSHPATDERGNRIAINDEKVNEAIKGEKAQLNINDVYEMSGMPGLEAIFQNMACEIEKVMGVFPYETTQSGSKAASPAKDNSK